MGSTQWEVAAGKGLISRSGEAAFSIQHIKATFIISQALDTRKRPQINDLQFELGNIQVFIHCSNAPFAHTRLIKFYSIFFMAMK